jgi:hypothetical protein
MSGVVIGLTVLILLIVIGAAIYFFTSDEEAKDQADIIIKEPVDDDSSKTVETVKTPEFNIVNGWIYDNKYNKMLKVAADGSLAVTGYKKDDDTAKWNFEPSDKSGYHYIVSSGGAVVPNKVMRITSSVIQTTTSKDATSRIKIEAVGDGYKLTDRTGRYYVKIQGSQILSVNDSAEASVFTIDPSQFYITLEETDSAEQSSIEGFTGNTTMVLSEHEVSCDNGGLSSLKLKKDGSKYKYQYGCINGIDTSGDVIEKLNTETTAESGQVGALSGQVIDCGDKMIKSAQLLYQDLELPGKIAYSYSCLPTPLNTSKCETKTTNPSAISDNIDALVDANVSCPAGKGITQLKYIKDSNNDIRYEYRCCPTA